MLRSDTCLATSGCDPVPHVIALFAAIDVCANIVASIHVALTVKLTVCLNLVLAIVVVRPPSLPLLPDARIH